MDSPFPQSSNPNPSPRSSDLPTTISLLKDAITVAESTIKSVSSFFSSSLSCRDSDPLLVCPYDPRHRVPPESLFRHSLICTSSPGNRLEDLGFLDTLHYPKSLKTQAQLQKENNRPFLVSPDDHNDLCFSLSVNGHGNGEGVADGYLPFFGSSSFFYKDCPGVVSFPEPEPDTANKSFSLPAILSSECANFIHHSQKEAKATPEIRILPSEFWALKLEVEAWSDCPAAYSYTMLRVASSLDLRKVGDCGLKRWLISNSPNFGILIDLAMRDHIFLLLKLCLKVIRTEALCSYNSLSAGSEKGVLNHNAVTFGSPKLVGSLGWLASQLSVLYGEASGKLFAIGMLKESLLQVGSGLMLFKFGQVKSGGQDGCSDLGEFSESESTGGIEIINNMEDRHGEEVFVSQVAAAVAALHERFFLEERIKSLRFSHPLRKHQLVNDYLYASAKACEIRERRPNYKAVSEHDDLFWHRVNNQDSGKAKTMEELLAEDRDYKRRRMSYRGKKVKRNPTEVLRDIIEEQMEEIKQVGQIGYNAKAAADVEAYPTGQNLKDITARGYEFQRGRSDTSEIRLESPGYGKRISAACTSTSKKHGDPFISDRSGIINDLQDREKELRFQYSDYQEDLKGSEHKNYGSRIPSIYSNDANFRKKFSHLAQRGDREAHDTECHSKTTTDTHRSSRSASYSAHDIEIERKKFISGTRSMNRGRDDSSQLKSTAQDEFEDRYDPSFSSDEFLDSYGEHSAGRSYMQLEKLS